MSTLSSPRQQETNSVVRMMFEFLLSKLTSRHGKRIIFITSLYFQVVRIERLKTDAIVKLNQIMKLATTEDALRFPAALRGFVWNKTNIAAILSEELMDGEISEARAREIAHQVVEATPQFLVYGRRADMQDDAFNLIFNGPQLAQAA